MDELYELLTNNYVEDSSCTFRFDYSREFLRWYIIIYSVPRFFVEFYSMIFLGPSPRLAGYPNGTWVSEERIKRNYLLSFPLFQLIYVLSTSCFFFHLYFLDSPNLPLFPQIERFPSLKSTFFVYTRVLEINVSLLL